MGDSEKALNSEPKYVLTEFVVIKNTNKFGTIKLFHAYQNDFIKNFADAMTAVIKCIKS